MSRIGKNPVALPDSVTVELQGQTLKAKGPKGELELVVHDDVSVVLEENDGTKLLRFATRSNSRQAKTLWPTMRSLAANIVAGVHEGFKKNLLIQGVGYRAQMQGNALVMQLGLSHEVRYDVPQGIQLAVENQTEIAVTGIDKQLVGQVAAKIRGYRPPEPYKGKGIRYADEYVMRKEGKKK